MCIEFIIPLTKYIQMVTTIICVFMWIPEILKEPRNVLYKFVLKAYFFINHPMSLTILLKIYVRSFVMIGSRESITKKQTHFRIYNIALLSKNTR